MGSDIKIVLIIITILLFLSIIANVILVIFLRKCISLGRQGPTTVSACDYEACGDKVFKEGSKYVGVGIIPELEPTPLGKLTLKIHVPMAIEINSQTALPKVQYGTSKKYFYQGTFILYKHDGSPGNEFYFTYGGCTENYFYDPESCKFSYTKSECTLDKELSPVDKGEPGNKLNCCSGNCSGKHSGANTVLRNIEYNGKTDTFSITLYNKDNKKASTFILNKVTKWPKKWPKTNISRLPRDVQNNNSGCTWNSTTKLCQCN